MDLENHLLMIPGPVTLHPRVLRALSKPIMGHREKDFQEIVSKARSMLKEVFQTKNDLIIISGSSTAGMDAALGNVIAPKDKVIVPVFGKFSERFRDIAKAYGADVIDIKKDYGDGITVDDIKNVLDKDVKAVALVQNETSTGVKTPVAEIGELLKDTNTLFIVDAVSSMGGDDVAVDKFNIDICVVGSQKALGLPPGLAFVSVSDKAWKVINSNQRKAYYLDLVRYKKAMESSDGNMPFTHPVSMIYALLVSLKIILKEGMDARIKRHKTMTKAVRNAVRAMNLEFFAQSEDIMSETVTSVRMPKDVDDKDIRPVMKSKHNITIAGGQGSMAGHIFRIAHMGTTTEREIIATIEALETVLKEAGHNLELGKGVTAVEKAFLDAK